MGKRILKYTMILFAIYFFLMVIAFSIPNKYLEKNVQKSVNVINTEGLYHTLNKSDKGSKLDNVTDRLMLNKTIKDESNPVRAAMSINGYSRYWHGYQVFLRPILVFIGYGNIRQLYGLILIVLIGLNFYFLFKKLDIFIAMAFLLSLYFVRFYTFFLSMQFSNVFIIMFLFNLYLLTKKTGYLLCNLCIPFFIAGSVTNFIDLLTVPMITLGVPLLLILYFEISHSKTRARLSINYILKILFLSIFWGVGYGLTWFFKWCIGTIVIRKNIFSDAFNTILFRTEGNKDYPLNRQEMFQNNIGLIINKLWLLIFAFFVVLIIISIIRRRSILRKCLNRNAVYLLLISVLPYIWYSVLSNHSQIHYWFTYRLQIVVIFAILSFLSYILKVVFSVENEQFEL